MLFENPFRCSSLYPQSPFEHRAQKNKFICGLEKAVSMDGLIYSMDLRERVVVAVQQVGMSRHQAVRLGVVISTATNCQALRRERQR